MTIRRATSMDGETLLDCWLRSVSATHAFVSQADIEAMVPDVRGYLSSNTADIWVACDDAGTVMGFMGMSGSKMDALFLAPECHRRGVGRLLVNHARALHAELAVDVNEQNVAALKFYEACGFAVQGRSELDEQGRPYPLLHLRLAPDPSNGWEAVAPRFIQEGRNSRIGVTVVTDWVNQMPPGGALLDLGCGPGGPRSEPLHARGTVFAIDASPSLARAYQERFPAAQVTCEPAEESALFGRQFDGVLAWGLLFLLPAAAQEEIIRRVAGVLEPGGRFLFTAPRQEAAWADNSTGRLSISLGRDTYRALLDAAGLELVGEHVDEGENHYYETIKGWANGPEVPGS